MPDPSSAAPSSPAPGPPGPGERLRLLAVHAHPDDESSKGAATMARYVSEGADVLVVTCTGGERGSVLNPALDRPEVVADLPRIRRAEMDRARTILGVRQTWLGFLDSGFPEGDPPPPLPAGCFARVPLEESATALGRVIREFRPHVVTTYDENGGYPHPDHVRCHEVTLAAVETAADPRRDVTAGPAWATPKLYYHHSFHRARTQALHEAMLARGLESPYAERLAEWTPDPAHDRRITTRVPCARWFPMRDEALRAHATQVDPDGPWFHVPLEVHQQVVADRGLRAGEVAGAHRRPRGRPVRRPAGRRPGAALGMTAARLLAGLVTQTDDPTLLERYQPGPVALLVVVLLALACVVLFLSMRRQLRRVRFDEDATDDAGRAASRERDDDPPVG